MEQTFEPKGERATLTFHRVDKQRWPDLVALFEASGGPKYCWCMVWRGTADERREWGGADTRVAARGQMSPANGLRKAGLHSRLDRGDVLGILGYDGDTPVAWCSIAPRDTYRRLGGPDADNDADVWSLVCFYLKRSHRGRGHGRVLLYAAIDYARRSGATIVEAYPVDPASPSYRFMGFVPAFSEAGFTEVGTAGSRRHVMRLALT